MTDEVLFTYYSHLSESLLGYNEYAALSSSTSLNDMVASLSTTSLARYVADVGDAPSPEALLGACKLRISHVLNRMLVENTGATFRWLRLLQHRYMIENVCLVLLNVIRNAGAETNELLAECHPAGLFEGLTAVAASDSLRDAIVFLHESTPLGAYFALSAESAQSPSPADVEEMRCAGLARWLEAVNAESQNMGEQTFWDLGEVLATEADRMSYSVALGRVASGAAAKDGAENPELIARKLMPRLGRMHPAGQLDMLRADSVDGVRAVAEAVPELRSAFAAAAASPGLMADDAFVQAEAAALRPTMASLGSAAPAYAWLRLAEIEARNLAWIAECVVAGQQDAAMVAVACE